MSSPYGGVRWRALLGARNRRARPHSEIDKPTFCCAYGKSQKNDGNDASAICESAGRPSMRFVPVKSAAQQDVQAFHRITFQLIKWRTALANEIRGLLGEYEIVVLQGIGASRKQQPPLILEVHENQLSGLVAEEKARINLGAAAEAEPVILR